MAATVPAHVIMPPAAAGKLLQHLLPALTATQQDGLHPLLSCLG